MEKQFNLLDEPWVRVLTNENHEDTVSLSQVLLQSNEYKRLNGEMAAQDIAVLRMMLGLLYSVFARKDAEGNPGEIEDEGDALDRWEELWERKAFPEKPLRDYFSEYHDRFWLVDPERPFYQIPQASIGTYYSAAKLNGAIAESGNKVRMFSERAGEEKTSLSFAESTRWLIYINGFDDTASKAKEKNLPSPGAGWLGRIGLIEAVGDNLFETLMLNLVLLREDGSPWAPITPEDCACWELEKPHERERVQIPQPDNYAALMTLQSRRIILETANGLTTGFWLLGGDFFDREDSFCEPMTIWRVTDQKGKVVTVPRRHEPSRQLWREFGSIVVDSEKHHLPGVEKWVALLIRNRLLDDRNRHINFQIVSVQYGNQDFFVTDSYSDSISMYASLLNKGGEKWRALIENEIDLCDQCARKVGELAVHLEKAAGNSGDISGTPWIERFYQEIDPVFRSWLYELDPEISREGEYVEKLRRQVTAIAAKVGKIMVRDAGPTAMQGREVAEKIKNVEKKRFYWAPQEYEHFLYQIRKVYQ
jgi:CRISPR system Cascade subunit CasA